MVFAARVRCIAWVAGLGWLSAAGALAAGQEARLTVTSEEDVAIVDTGAMRLAVDGGRGLIRELSAAGKTFITGNTAPLLSATLMESSAYDSVRDFTPRTFLESVYSFNGLTVRSDDNEFRAEGRGALTFPGGDAIHFELRLATARDSRHLRVAVALKPEGAFKHRYIRAVALRQPMALNSRKRIIQAGDQGLRWDTRHRYQFHSHVTFATEPEHNWWRHFYVDQESTHSYRVWRAESLHTAPLVPFHGRRAAGWMTAYDEGGGVLFAYRGMPERAPKALYVNADGGAEACLYIYSPTQPAFDLGDRRLAAAVFGATHETDWVFFVGDEAIEQPDRLLAKAWGLASLASDPPAKLEPVDDEVDLFDAPLAADDRAPYAVGGIPLPRGAVRGAEQLRVHAAGREVPLQARAHAYWPDGSIKWALLTFPLDGSGRIGSVPGAGAGDSTDFEVTLHRGAPLKCRLEFGRGVSRDEAPSPLRVTEADGQTLIHTGPLAVTLSAGVRWLRSALLNGREMLRDDGRAQAHVDFLRVQRDYIVGTTHPEGELDPGPVEIEKITLEERGPLRVVVRLEGRAKAREAPRVILRLEAYAGRAYLRVSKTVEFTHKDPRRVFVRRIGLHLPVATARASRCAAGGQDGPVSLPAASMTGLRQTSHLNYELWQADGTQKHRELRDNAHRSRGWLDVSGEAGGLAVVVRNMWQEFPKELIVRTDAPAFEIGLWPESAPLMDVRRYSDYPHRGQGESVAWDRWWVEDTYYPKDPFAGVTKTHEMLLYFHDARTTPAQIDAVASGFQSQPLIHAGWDWYAGTRITIPQISPDDPRFGKASACMANFADWWLFHQRSWGWYGMWDYGDVRHLFHDGYGKIFPPETLAKLLRERNGVRNTRGLSGLPRRKDYFPQNDWAYDNGRWGWGNTEGLPNLFMSMQYLRTGRRDLFFFMEANARHVRDVDARHAGVWFGRGTRHGVQHWSDGNHEERQTTFAEQRFHYLLTGEPRTREWNRRLTDDFYLRGTCPDDASHSGRAYGLLTRWEITGDPELGDILRRYMRCLALPRGLAVNSAIAFPEVRIVGEPRELHGNSMFFHTFGAMHAMLEYAQLTGDPRVREAIVKTAGHAVSRDTNDVDGMYRKVLAFAAREAEDGEKYRAALAERLTGRDHRMLFQLAPTNRARWTGDAAFPVSVPSALFWINDAAYALTALDREPTPTEAQLAEMERAEKQPVAGTVRPPRESWQSEYDKPEFEAYFREKPRAR